MRRSLCLILLFLSSLLVLLSCGGGDKTETYRVMVTTDEGATVTSENPLEVAHGSDCEFTLELKSTYTVDTVSAGSFDAETGKLTVKNVTEKLNITVTTKDMGYDTTEKVMFVFNGAEGDTSSVKNTSQIFYGTSITVEAKNTARIFVGWSIGKNAEGGGEILSTDRVYTFNAAPEMVVNGAIRLYANYKDSNIFYYNPNGGMVNTASQNMKASDYYRAELEGELVKVTLLENYFSFAECATAFWSDGTFTREGYVLTEYNTKPDGSGEAYSLGSKFYTVDGNNHTTLYCMWDKVSEGFEYTDFTFNRPSGITEKTSPEWCESGVIITRYNGDSERVAVPESIDGKPVIAIAADCFVGKQMKTLILPRHLLSVADGAVRSCSSLTALYYPDGIYAITDNALDAASYTSLKSFYVNASICPRFSATDDGAFAVKLSRLLASEKQNRVIVISGSSSYLGLATEYLEALLDNKYRVINLGTTRTTHGAMYLEAMGKLAHEGDMVIYAPENSSYMFGETELYWKTLRDLEGMNNIYRYVDISNYTAVFSAFADFNQTYRYKRVPAPYELICTVKYTDKYGDRREGAMAKYVDMTEYKDSYYVTFTKRIKSKYDTTSWLDVEYHQNNRDYDNPENNIWCSIDDGYMLALMNHAIDSARSSGANVYFGFAPTDASSIVPNSQSSAALAAYDETVRALYHFDGLMGSAEEYVFDRKYFHDCAFHTNDYGRVYRTYTLYRNIAATAGITDINGIFDVGVEYAGCLFESDSTGTPVTKVSYLEK